MLKFAKDINFRDKNFVTVANCKISRPFANCNCARVSRVYFDTCTVLVPCTSSATVDWSRWRWHPLASFEVLSCVRGYHIYKTVWTSYIGETLPCSQENTIGHDPFAVKILQLGSEEETIVGHLPRKISSACSLFVRKGGQISAIVCRSRRFSRDLVQGGLEIVVSWNSKPHWWARHTSCLIATKRKKMAQSHLASNPRESSWKIRKILIVPPWQKARTCHRQHG